MTETEKPICRDLYCGLGGWAEGFIAEGFNVIGYDIERHDYGAGGYPGTLVLRDVREIHGSELADATVIVASPPCTEYSYMAMPWKRAKQIARALRQQDEFPAGYKGSRTIPQLNELFNTCFRIRREANEAAGRYIPLIVENAKGAQPWVGRSAWNFGSFHLWGDVPALMPTVRGRKNRGGSWFNVAPHNSECGQNPDGRKLPSDSGRRTDIGNGVRFTSCDCGIEGVKQHGSGREWFAGEGKISRVTRKAASAHIARIPFPLAQWIASCYKPSEVRSGT